MTKVLVLPCKDQEDIIKFHLERLAAMHNRPDHVVIIDDHSVSPTIKSSEDGWIKVVQGKERGRATTRNRGMLEALDLGADIIIFMDGDSIAEDDLYFDRLDTLFEEVGDNSMIYGTRVHMDRPRNFNKWYNGEETVYRGYPRKPSDLLTANMDNLQNGRELDHSDLREVSKVVEAFENAEDFNEKVDLVLSGMVSWSCNFALTRKAAIALLKFMKKVYGTSNMFFDEVAFRDQWGYEDVAFGLDSLFAGVDVRLQDQARVIHFMHGRSDELYTHIGGRHLIMQRYRHIIRTLGIDKEKPQALLRVGATLINKNTIEIQGRSFLRKPPLDGSVSISEAGDISIGDYSYDYVENLFKKRKKNNIIRARKAIIRYLKRKRILG